MSERSQLQGASIRRRRAGQKGWATRMARAAGLAKAASELAEIGKLLATIVTRTVERQAKPDFLKNYPGTSEREIIDFWQARFEAQGFLTEEAFAAKLDAGECVETSKAWYRLSSRTERQGTEAERRAINLDDLNKIINARMQCR